MNIVARLLLLLTLIVVPVVIYATSHALPTRVASHFGRGGLANGWMSHDGYVLFMLVMSTVFPLVVAASTGLVPAAGRMILRRRAIAAERIDDAVRWLAGAASIVGVLIAALILGMHFLMLEANARTPARLDESAFFTMIVAFLALLAIWIVALARRMRQVR
jgi:hypothetical protein